MKSFVACLVLLSLAFHDISATKFKPCDALSGNLISLDISGCPDDQEFCILKKGTSKTITAVFVSKTDSPTVTAYAQGFKQNSTYPFALPNINACVSGGLVCPMEIGKSYTYTQTVEFGDSLPPPPSGLQWFFTLYDDKELDIVCVEVSCRVE